MAKGIFDKILDPLFGNTEAEDRKARDAMEQAAAQFKDLSIPELKEINPELYKWLGDYNPQLLGPQAQVSGTTIAARPGVKFDRIAAALPSSGPDVQAERIQGRTADAATIGPSAMEGISTDPRLKDAQLAALAAMQDIADSGGMTAAERAQMNRLQNEVAQADRGRREAILQGMRQRGLGGSGMELLAQLDSSQAATDRASQAGLDIAGMAQERALKALMSSGDLAGGIRGQDFGQQAQIAAAMDAVEKFNAANTQQARQFNAGMLTDADKFNSGIGMDAQKFNRSVGDEMARFRAGIENDTNRFNASNDVRIALANRDYDTDVAKFNAGVTNDFAKYGADRDLTVSMHNNNLANQAGMYSHAGAQKAADANVGAINSAKQHNTFTIPTTTYDMAYKKAGGTAGGLQGMSNFWQAQGDREAAKDAQVFGGVVTGAAAAAKAASDKNSKKDIADLSFDDVMDFLKSVKPKTYKYKPEYAEGDHGVKVGFIMQDIEGTKVGKAISREKNGMKAYDPQSLQGVMLAALKCIADKVEKKK